MRVVPAAPSRARGAPPMRVVPAAPLQRRATPMRAVGKPPAKPALQPAARAPVGRGARPPARADRREAPGPLERGGGEEGGGAGRRPARRAGPEVRPSEEWVDAHLPVSVNSPWPTRSASRTSSSTRRAQQRRQGAGLPRARVRQLASRCGRRDRRPARALRLAALSSGAKVQDFHAHESVNSPRAVADKIGVPHWLFDSPR